MLQSLSKSNMKIDSLSTTKVLSYLNSKHCPFEMKLHDWRVFLEWMSHNGDYDVSGVQIQNRTGIDRTNISKAFKRLKEYGILKATGKKYIGHGRAVIMYFFTDEFKIAVEKHWSFLTGVDKGTEIKADFGFTDCEPADDLLDIPVEEFQGVVIDEDFDREMGYIKTDFES